MTSVDVKSVNVTSVNVTYDVSVEPVRMESVGGYGRYFPVEPASEYLIRYFAKHPLAKETVEYAKSVAKKPVGLESAGTRTADVVFVVEEKTAAEKRFNAEYGTWQSAKRSATDGSATDDSEESVEAQPIAKEAAGSVLVD